MAAGREIGVGRLLRGGLRSSLVNFMDVPVRVEVDIHHASLCRLFFDS